MYTTIKIFYTLYEHDNKNMLSKYIMCTTICGSVDLDLPSEAPAFTPALQWG